MFETGDMPLIAACREAGVKKTTFYNWLRDDVDGLAERYARAKGGRVFWREEECDEIADDGSNDRLPTGAIQSEVVRRSEIRIKRREGQSTKWLPVALGGMLGADLTGNVIINIDSGDAAI